MLNLKLTQRELDIIADALYDFGAPEYEASEISEVQSKLAVASQRDDEDFFPISYLHRDDITERGYDASKLTDADMVRFADRMHDADMEGQYWISIACIAEEVFGLAKNVR